MEHVGSEMVDGSWGIHGDDLVHGGEMIHGNEVGHDEMIQGRGMIEGNEIVAVDELRGNEIAQVNGMINGDEIVHGNELVSAEMTPQISSMRRWKKSLIWECFTIEAMPHGNSRACCNLCKSTFAYGSGTKIAGTSHLKRHITLGSCPVMKSDERKRALTSAGGTDNDGEGTLERPAKRRYGYTGYTSAGR